MAEGGDGEVGGVGNSASWGCPEKGTFGLVIEISAPSKLSARARSLYNSTREHDLFPWSLAGLLQLGHSHEHKLSATITTRNHRTKQPRCRINELDKRRDEDCGATIHVFVDPFFVSN